MPGFGLNGFGGVPFGFAVPAAAPVPGPSPMLSGRRIDPVTGQYVFDAYGRLTGMSTVQQLVMLAVKTRRGSSVLRTLGSSLHDIQDITSDFPRRVNDALRTALAPLVKAKQVEVLNVTIDRVGPSTTYVRLTWRDLTTMQEHVTTI